MFEIQQLKKKEMSGLHHAFTFRQTSVTETFRPDVAVLNFGSHLGINA